MREFRDTSLASQPLALPLRPQPPAWTSALIARNDAADADPTFSITSVVLADPPDEDADTFAAAVSGLYRSLAARVRELGRHVVRIWNFVPDIQGKIDGAGDRYMAFNIGRFAAYGEWFGLDAFRTNLPTSSAVGIRENALHVHALTCIQPGRPVENPRQIPSYRYSRRYGRRPPCFARATRVDSTLLIGGTASILGERSSHPDDVDAQTRETFRNISALVQAGSDTNVQLPLGCLKSLRLHVREADDAPAVMSVLHELELDRLDLELVEAPLCRKELLIEIEGVASYS